MEEGMMKLEDKVSRFVERPVTMDMNALVAHLKAIGSAIIDDADHLAVDTNRLRMVRVEAEIAPGEGLTAVTYTLERIADARIK